MDAEHLFRFRSQSCVFKFIRHSVDEALKIKSRVRYIKQTVNFKSLPNARISTGKTIRKVRGDMKVVHTFAVICDTLSDLLHLL